MQLGDIQVPFRDGNTLLPTFLAPTADSELIPRMEDFMDALRRDGDSIGAKIEVHAKCSGWPW